MRITTDQAPIAKQSSKGKILSTDWETIIDVPDYDIPVASFTENRQVAKCAIELVSPLIVSNAGGIDCNYSLQILKAQRYLDSTHTQENYAGQTSEVDGVVYGGTFNGGVNYVLGETITLSNDAKVRVDLIGDSGEVVEFSISQVGNAIDRPGIGYVVLTSSTDDVSGYGFVLYAAEDNFVDDTTNSFVLANSHPVLISNTSSFYLNGHILLSGDRLQMKANNAANLHVFISYTEGQAEENQPL